MPYNFSLVWAPWEAAEIRRRVDALEAALPAGTWPNYVLGNHDEERLAARFGPGPARVAAMLLLTLRGTPTIFYGDELGMMQVDVPPERQQDPWGLRVPGLSRDGNRTPMQWEPGPGHGFTGPGVEPWLPFGPDAAECNAARQLGAAGSMLELYRSLLALRRSEPALHAGSYRAVTDVPAGVFGYEREEGEDRVRVFLNFTGDERTVAAAGEVLLSTHPDLAVSVAGGLVLRPDEGIVIRPAPA